MGRLETESHVLLQTEPHDALELTLFQSPTRSPRINIIDTCSVQLEAHELKARYQVPTSLLADIRPIFHSGSDLLTAMGQPHSLLRASPRASIVAQQ